MADTDTESDLRRNYSGDNAGKPQRRKPRRNGWSKKKQRLFLETLVETCNVTAAAKAAGISGTCCYDLRRRDPVFRAGWEEALVRGYDRLELALLDRAINGTGRQAIVGDKEMTVITYNDGAGLRLLLAHRETVLRIRRRENEADDPDEVFAELKSRLAEMRARESADGAASDG